MRIVIKHWRKNCILLFLSFNCLACTSDKEAPNVEAPQEATEQKEDPGIEKKLEQVAKDISYLVSENGAGPIQLNTSIASLRLTEEYRIEKENVLTDGGKVLEMLFLVSQSNNRRLLSFKTNSDGLISRIYVSDPIFKTASNLGVGSQLKQLKRFYTISHAIGNAFGNVYVYTEEAPQIAFEVLGTKNVVRNKEVAVEDLNDQQVISKLYISDDIKQR